MACFRPLEAWQSVQGGALQFSPPRRGQDLRQLQIACGRCIGCRQKRQRAWALRILHEVQLPAYTSLSSDASNFVTFTYDDSHYSPGLRYADYQAFMYRLRDRVGPTRFFCAGEYGEQSGRAHFHAVLFGREFRDGGKIGKDLYRSRTLEKLWPHGFVSAGAVTYQSAAYVAGYCLKKVSGPRSEEHYRQLDWRTGEVVSVPPEMARMSLKPGIGYTWFQKYWREVYGVRDGCVLPGGKVAAPPRYYDKLLEELDYGLSEERFFERYQTAEGFAADCTPERLAVREHVAKARNNQYRRGL